MRTLKLIAVLFIVMPIYAQHRPAVIPDVIVRDIINEMAEPGPLQTYLLTQRGRAELIRSLKMQRIDLDGDRVPEYIIKLEYKGYCGASGNCDFYVYQKVGEGFGLLLTENGQKLYPKQSRNLGYLNLACDHAMGAMETAITEYQWDGSTYKQLMCFSRKYGEKPRDIRTVIIRCDSDEPTASRETQTYPRSQQYQAPPVSAYERNYSEPSIGLLNVSTSFTVGASQHAHYPIVVTGRENNRIIGRFQATGGRGNDIEVFILDPDSYTNWRNRHTVQTWYNSGRVTVGNINAMLPPGQYVLIFNNGFSLISPKAVSVQIQQVAGY